MVAERQSVEGRPRARQRGRTIRPSTTAPEITLTVAKLAASMSSCRKASLHNKELAANASIVTIVSNTVLAEIDLEFPEGIAATLITIFFCNSRDDCLYPASSPQQTHTGQLILGHLVRGNIRLWPEIDIPGVTN
jgi:hypothetical protein